MTRRISPAGSRAESLRCRRKAAGIFAEGKSAVPADQLPIFFQKPLIFPGLYDILVKDLILKGITKEWAKPTLSV